MVYVKHDVNPWIGPPCGVASAAPLDVKRELVEIVKDRLVYRWGGLGRLRLSPEDHCCDESLKFCHFDFWYVLNIWFDAKQLVRMFELA